MVESKTKAVKRFGARYGKKLKVKIAKVEAIQRGKHQCPYCHAWRVKRLSAGIWQCRKCNAKFTGKAYSIKKLIINDEEESKKKKKRMKKDAEEKGETYKEAVDPEADSYVQAELKEEA